jgi:hypothetical protein
LSKARTNEWHEPSEQNRVNEPTHPTIIIIIIEQRRHYNQPIIYISPNFCVFSRILRSNQKIPVFSPQQLMRRNTDGNMYTNNMYRCEKINELILFDPSPKTFSPLKLRKKKTIESYLLIRFDLMLLKELLRTLECPKEFRGVNIAQKTNKIWYFFALLPVLCFSINFR